MHRRRLRAVLAALLLAGTSDRGPASAASIAIGEAEMPAVVAARAPAVAAAALAIEAARAREGFVRRSFGPDAEAGAGLESFRTGALAPALEPYGGLRVGLNLYRGGRDGLEESERAARTDALRASRESLLRETVEAARAHVWSLAAHRAIAALVERHRTEVERLRRATAVRISRGIAPPSDRTAVLLHERRLSDRLETARREARIEEIRLAALLGFASETSFETLDPLEAAVPGESAPPTVEDGRNPEADRLRAEAAAHRAESSRHARWWAPSLDAYGSAWLYTTPERSYDRLGDRREWTAGLRLSLAPFDGGRGVAEARAAGLRSDALSAAAAAGDDRSRAEREAAREEIRRLHALVASSQAQVALARGWLAETLDEYRRGVRDSIATLAVFERVLALEEEQIARQCDHRQARASLESRLGR